MKRLIKLHGGLNVSKLLRIVAFATILSLLVMLIPAAPVLAAESLRLSPTKGEIGDRITVTGSDYDYNDKVYIYFSSQEADKGDYIDDDLELWEEVGTSYADGVGKISDSFKVPSTLTDGDEEEDVHGGEYYVYTTYKKEGKILAVTKFTVTGITISPTEGPVGTEVEIEGVGFDKEENIEIFYDGDEIDIASGDDETDKKGKFELTIIIPKSAAGAHTITVEIYKDKGEAKFTVEPKMAISTTSGRIGDRVTVTGTGFGDGVKVVTITFGGAKVATGKIDGKGSFSIRFDVPGVAAGTYDVEVEDEDGNSCKAKFTTSTDISVSPVTTQASPGHVGMEVTISGTGFIPDHKITITYTSAPVVFTTTSEDDGSFSYTFKIPKSEPGEHTVTASDGVNSLEVTFFMESTAPAIPVPLLPPPLGIKAEQPVKFDWGDVTDPSGITYTLQAARNMGFTDIVLERKGLTKSEYTMTEEEKLESTKKDAPYWWRVKAIDGASNESGWSDARSFYVGYVFEMPNWAIYLLIGLGGVALFFIGFVIGRRSVAYC